MPFPNRLWPCPAVEWSLGSASLVLSGVARRRQLFDLLESRRTARPQQNIARPTARRAVSRVEWTLRRERTLSESTRVPAGSSRWLSSHTTDWKAETQGYRSNQHREAPGRRQLAASLADAAQSCFPPYDTSEN